MTGKNGLVSGWLAFSLTSTIASLTKPMNQLLWMTYLKSSGPLCLMDSNLLIASFASEGSCKYLRNIPHICYSIYLSLESFVFYINLYFYITLLAIPPFISTFV